MTSTDTTLSITEVKRRFDEVYERVAAGERIVVTKWGRPVVALERVTDAPEGRGKPPTYD